MEPEEHRLKRRAKQGKTTEGPRKVYHKEFWDGCFKAGWNKFTKKASFRAYTTVMLFGVGFIVLRTKVWDDGWDADSSCDRPLTKHEREKYELCLLHENYFRKSFLIWRILLRLHAVVNLEEVGTFTYISLVLAILYAIFMKVYFRFRFLYFQGVTNILFMLSQLLLAFLSLAGYILGYFAISLQIGGHIAIVIWIELILLPIITIWGKANQVYFKMKDYSPAIAVLEGYTEYIPMMILYFGLKYRKVIILHPMFVTLWCYELIDVTDINPDLLWTTAILNSALLLTYIAMMIYFCKYPMELVQQKSEHSVEGEQNQNQTTEEEKKNQDGDPIENAVDGVNDGVNAALDMHENTGFLGNLSHIVGNRA